MSFVTNGEHDQMMRDQQRDLRRIATALEMANHIKVIELAMMHCQGDYDEEDMKDHDLMEKCVVSLLEDNGWKVT